MQPDLNLDPDALDDAAALAAALELDLRDLVRDLRAVWLPPQVGDRRADAAGILDRIVDEIGAAAAACRRITVAARTVDATGARTIAR